MRGADVFQYDIELRFNGDSLRGRAHDLASDESLRGMLMIASRLLDRTPLAVATTAPAGRGTLGKMPAGPRNPVISDPRDDIARPLRELVV